MSTYTPEELTVQIFSRLPSKPLLRFMCLSKSWKSQISSAGFIWLHTQQTVLSKPSTGEIMRYFSITKRKERNLIWNDDGETILTVTSPLNGNVGYYHRVLGISHGLICLLNDLFGNKELLVLWNPMVGRCLTLPMPPLCYENITKYKFVFGFGFAIKTRDYKVARMAYAHSDGGYLVPPKVEIYALSTGIWKEFDGFIPDIGVLEYFWRQAVVCGKVHGTAYKRNGDGRVENLIMVFDLNDEIFQELALPDLLVNEPSTNLNAAEFRESLAVYQYDRRIWSSSSAIWVMKQYGVSESWSKEYNVVLHDQNLGMVLAVSNNTVLLTEASGMLALYDVETQEKLCLGIVGTKYSFYFGTYEESLVLLDKGEVLPPLDLSSSESDDDEDEDQENDPRTHEAYLHLVYFSRASNI